MQKSFDLITFSDMCVDLIVTGDDVTPQFGQVEKLVQDYTLEMGGSCNIFACQAAKLGMRVAVVGRVGKDNFGQLILHRLEECGVDTRFVTVDPDIKTGIGVALCPPGDRAILTYMGSIDAVVPEDITDDILSTTRHVHHASHYLHTRLVDAMPNIFHRARALGATTSLDTNWDPEERWQGVDGLLPLTDVFLPNDQEAVRISRKPDPGEAAAQFLEMGVKIVAVKAGPEGSCIYTLGGSFERAVTPVTGGDSVGAGDSYDAGFLAGWLRGFPITDCLSIATQCGRSVASQAGGLAGQLTWDEIER